MPPSCATCKPSPARCLSSPPPLLRFTSIATVAHRLGQECNPTKPAMSEDGTSHTPSTVPSLCPTIAHLELAAHAQVERLLDDEPQRGLAQDEDEELRQGHAGAGAGAGVCEEQAWPCFCKCSCAMNRTARGGRVASHPRTVSTAITPTQASPGTVRQPDRTGCTCHDATNCRLTTDPSRTSAPSSPRCVTCKHH